MSQIPKIIHYCWFGYQPYSKVQKLCINSWQAKLPDYEFRLWNEDNIDMSHPFIAYAYKHKKWAFVSDYVRLQKLFDYGGIYLDTDMYLTRSLNPFLTNGCFLGAEDSTLVNAAIIGANKHNDYIKACLEYYETKDLSEKHLNLAIPRVLTRTLIGEDGFYELFTEIKTLNKVVVYPPAYFYPMPYDINKAFDKQFKKFIKKETYAIHLWDGSWVDYSEFQLIRRGSYFEALKKIITKPSQTLDFKYIKKILRTFVKTLFKRVK